MKSPGLTRRRLAEQALFSTPDPICATMGSEMPRKKSEIPCPNGCRKKPFGARELRVHIPKCPKRKV